MTGDEPVAGESRPAPGVIEASRRGLVLVFGQPRKLATVAVLLLVLLVPVLGRVSSGTAFWLTTFVVISLLPVTYIRRDGATARVSLLWLAGVAGLCALLSASWLGLLLVLVLVPYTAIPAAAWASGSWRIGARAVARMLRDTWLSTIGLCLLVTGTFALMVGLAFAIGVGGVPVGAGLLLIIAFVWLEATLGIGYALVAIERAELSPP